MTAGPLIGTFSSYPPPRPTRPASAARGYNLRRGIEIRAGSHAFEARFSPEHASQE